MKTAIHVICLAAILPLFFACESRDKFYSDRFWVVSEGAGLYDRPTAIANVIKKLKFGDELNCRDKNPSFSVAKGWVEAKSGMDYGYIEKKHLAGEDVYNDMQKAMEESGEAEVMASGLTAKKTALFMKPDKDAQVIETLKEPKNADVLEQILVSPEGGVKKYQAWYRVRLDDGRVGFVKKGSVRLNPPNEISQYTQIRVPVSWYVLREKEDEETGEKGRDYLVTYSAIGSDADIDFTRIELYVYDLKQKKYSTALARSGLYGKLPVKIAAAENGGKLIEIREHPKGNRGKLRAIQYSFPSPIRIVKEFEAE